LVVVRSVFEFSVGLAVRSHSSVRDSVIVDVAVGRGVVASSLPRRGSSLSSVLPTPALAPRPQHSTSSTHPHPQLSHRDGDSQVLSSPPAAAVSVSGVASQLVSPGVAVAASLLSLFVVGGGLFSHWLSVLVVGLVSLWLSVVGVDRCSICRWSSPALFSGGPVSAGLVVDRVR